MKAVVLIFTALFSTAFSQTPDIKSNPQIMSEIETLSRSEKETKSERTKLLWVLVMRSAQGDSTIHKQGRAIAENMEKEKGFDPRVKFARGYFRLKEGLDTFEPITRKRRIDEGRRIIGESLSLGGRDADFQLDAGIALVGLPLDVKLCAEGINALALSKRAFGEKFNDLPKDRQADWWVATAAGLDAFRIEEMARDYYKTAVSLAPESVSGRKAAAWLRSRGS